MLILIINELRFISLLKLIYYCIISSIGFIKGDVRMTNKDIKISKSEQTRKRIIFSYLELMRDKKWDKITVKELCEYINITRGTFYQYFNDIYDLMEQIQNQLLDDLNNRYLKLPPEAPANYPLEQFAEKFNYTPPQRLTCWFSFCKRNKHAMTSLLNPNTGNTYFVKKLKRLLETQINIMMDNDGMPNDKMRSHFIKIFLELHFLSARTWLDSKPGEFLPTNEIQNLLNTMRVGGSYLTYKKYTSNDYEEKMSVPEQEGELK